MTKSITKPRPEMPIYFGLSIFLLVIGFLFGWQNPSRFRAQLTPSLKQLVESIQSTQGDTSWLHTFWVIFLNNATTTLEMALFGIVVGIFPVFSMWLNGLLSGFVISLAQQQDGIPAWQTIVYGILPHGIFELTAIFWAAALGIANGMATLRAIRLAYGRQNTTRGEQKRDDPLHFRERHPLRFSLLRTARSLPIIWGILFIAALVEATVTPHIMAWGVPGIHH